MRTAVLYGKEDIRIEDRPVPEPGPGQMLVKIDYVGICGTDIELNFTSSDRHRHHCQRFSGMRTPEPL